MKRQRLTIWLLLMAMSLFLSGAAQAVHERLDHQHRVVSAADSPAHAGHSHDAPAAPHPSDHDDCPTCFLLLHLKASALDLQTPPTPDARPCAIASIPFERIVTCDRTQLPDTRGPPIAHL